MSPGARSDAQKETARCRPARPPTRCPPSRRADAPRQHARDQPVPTNPTPTDDSIPIPAPTHQPSRSTPTTPKPQHIPVRFRCRCDHEKTFGPDPARPERRRISDPSPVSPPMADSRRLIPSPNTTGPATPTRSRKQTTVPSDQNRLPLRRQSTANPTRVSTRANVSGSPRDGPGSPRPPAPMARSPHPQFARDAHATQTPTPTRNAPATPVPQTPRDDETPPVPALSRSRTTTARTPNGTGRSGPG